jgi:hypothetical protein
VAQSKQLGITHWQQIEIISILQCQVPFYEINLSPIRRCIAELLDTLSLSDQPQSEEKSSAELRLSQV